MLPSIIKIPIRVATSPYSAKADRYSHDSYILMNMFTNTPGFLAEYTGVISLLHHRFKRSCGVLLKVE